MKDILTFKVKRPKKKAQPRKRNKVNDLDRKLVYITRVISRGDYDPNKTLSCDHG